MNDDVSLPPCGLYRTTSDLGDIPAGRLVYFHNHGDPGPGVYLPASWRGNRARWHERGQTLSDLGDVKHLQPIAAEGFYRVREAFHCCEKQCRLFEAETLVQLGYNAAAEPILFSPEIVDGLLAVPERGTRIDRERIEKMTRLKVPMSQGGGPDTSPDGEHPLMH